jgi:hypothetical protein
MSNKYVTAAIAHFEGKKLEAEAVLDTYFNHSIGIGEHSELPSEIYKWVDRLASAEDSLLALERYEDRQE